MIISLKSEFIILIFQWLFLFEFYKYIHLSSFKVLLILLVQQDPISCCAFIKSISEFRVPLPVLSLAVSSISVMKLNSGSGEGNFDEDDDEEEGILTSKNALVSLYF